MRKEVPVAVAGICGFLVLINFFFEKGLPFTKGWVDALQNWGVVVSAFAMGLAAVNLVFIQVRHIARRSEGWYNSVALLVAMFLSTASGIVFYAAPRAAWAAGLRSLWTYLFNGLLKPLGAAMFATLVFFIASASFRSFRARSVEAAILLGAGLIALLGAAPIGELISGVFPRASNWIMDVPNVAGNRAIIMGAAIGAVALGFRILLGIDRTYMGGE